MRQRGLVASLSRMARRIDTYLQALLPEDKFAFYESVRDFSDSEIAPHLLDWERQAPHARHAHPTVEHLMPLFVALGAAGDGATARPLHASHEYGSLALDAFAFH